MKLWRWVAGAAGAVAIAGVAFVGWVYAASEIHLHSFPKPPPFTTPIPTDAASLAHGEHLARTRGCSDCHGAHLEGGAVEGDPTPNIAKLSHEVDASTLEAAIRHGIDHTGRAVYSMPAYNFVNLTNADVADIIGYMRAMPVQEGQTRKRHMPFSVRLDIALGHDDAIAGFLDRLPPLTHQHDANPAVVRGEYLANTSCNECHGFSLRADVPWGGNGAPDLVSMIGAYPEADFRTLMRTGVPIGGRDLGMMGAVARYRFAHWSDEEVGDIYTYLRVRNAEMMATTNP